MKIKDIIQEAGFLRGFFKGISKQAVDSFQRWKETRADTQTKEGFRYKDYYINWDGKNWLSWDFDNRKYELAPLEIQRELDTLASGQSVSVPTKPSPTTRRMKKGMQVVVDGPRELTVRYDGQLYSTKGGVAPWTITKTGKEVNQSFAKVLDQEYHNYCQDQTCNIEVN